MAADEAVESGTSIAETDIGAALAAVNEAARSDAAKAAGPTNIDASAAVPHAEDVAPVVEDQSPA
jgi:hypothetical protein